MGFGLMGAGAAVKGLVSGYQQGRKFAQDEERFDMEKEKFGLDKQAAEQSRRLREEQIKGAALVNRRAQGELDDVDFNRQVDDRAIEITRRGLEAAYGPQPVANPTAAGVPAPAPAPAAASAPAGISDPAAAPVAQAAPAAGIQAPDAPASPAGSPAPGAQPAARPRSRLELLAEMNRDLLNNQLQKRGVDRNAILRQAVESARFYSNAKTQLTLDAMQQIQAGVPQEEVLAGLEAQGVPVKPGTTFSKVRGKDPKTGVEYTDVVINVPGAEPISERELSRAILPKEALFNLELGIGKLNAQISHQSAMEEIARDNARASVLQHEQVLKRMDMQIRQHAESFNLQRDQFRYNKTVDDRKEASRYFDKLYNFTPLNDIQLEKLRKEDEDRPINLDDKGKPDPNKRTRVQQYEDRLAQAGRDSLGASLLYVHNIDPVTLKPTVREPVIASAIAMLKKDPSKLQFDSDGWGFVEVGGTRVKIPERKPEPSPAGAPAQAPAPASAPTGAPAQAPASRPGISPPANQLPPQAEQAGAAVDAARQRVVSASEALQRFGLRQRQQDPGGYEAARRALEAARAQLAQAESAYQGALPAGLTQAFSR